MIKSILPLSSIIALRFLGLFLVLPVISAYAINLEGATTTLVGVVVGGYALTQMIFQVPFGVISDKLGRKGTIIMGLILFIIGSLICAMSSDIWTLVLGRFLQGAGAIGAVVTAMISDLVPEEKRPKAMALMGGSIAMAFAISMLAGPTIGGFFGIEILFYITALLGVVSIFVLIKKVPNPPQITHTYNAKAKMSEVLGNANLIKMNITNFLQKGLMTFAFMIIPMVLTRTIENGGFGWQMTDLWQVYLPAMILGVIAMGPAAVMAEKKGKFKEILIIGIVFFSASYLILGLTTSSVAFIVGVAVFFIGFNMHEPIMQSLASKFAKVHQRGLVLGIFNSAGYLGTFIGGVVGGMFFQSASLSSIVIAIAIICVIWVILIAKMPNPAKMKFVYLPLNEYKLENTEKLHNDLVEEWYVNNTENIIAVKYNSETSSEEQVKALLR